VQVNARSSKNAVQGLSGSVCIASRKGTFGKEKKETREADSLKKSPEGLKMAGPAKRGKRTGHSCVRTNNIRPNGCARFQRILKGRDDKGGGGAEGSATDGGGGATWDGWELRLKAQLRHKKAQQITRSAQSRNKEDNHQKGAACGIMNKFPY